ncbi:MAG: hypothetical protein WD749_10515 [Phycisphaerales bacterium]
MIHAKALDPRDPTRVMFQRFLACWATDLLALRRAALDTPRVRAGENAGPAWPGPERHEDEGPAPVRPFLPALRPPLCG